MTDSQPSKKTDESSGDEHFSDASEGENQRGKSPIPITRVERVDDVPAHGEVPGTESWKLRTQDAVPDEVEIVPDGLRSRSSSRLRPEDRPLTPGGTPVPILLVEKVDPETPAHGEVEGTAAYEMRKMDASPDIILKAPEPPKSSDEEQPRNDSIEDTKPSASLESTEENDIDDDEENDDDDNNEGFGDDFDEFEEGEEGDDDFGDFDDGFQQDGGFHTAIQPPRTPVPPPVQSVPLSVPPILDFNDYSTLDDIVSATQPYITNLFPSLVDLPTDQPIDSKDLQNHSIFLSERSLSLWSQLVAPPPLQPPNWVRSRIRRLFLVSLGVPVDLDEILPASKQKKLVLPSIHLPSDRSPRLSSSSPDRANGAVQRLKQSGANASSASVESSSSKPGGASARTSSKRRGPPPAPELDLSATTILCSTTEAALVGFTDEELRAHVTRLEELLVRAGEVLEYWGKRRESAMGDKEAFEGVIENLVKHAKKVRK